MYYVLSLPWLLELILTPPLSLSLILSLSPRQNLSLRLRLSLSLKLKLTLSLTHFSYMYPNHNPTIIVIPALPEFDLVSGTRATEHRNDLSTTHMSPGMGRTGQEWRGGQLGVWQQGRRCACDM